MAATPWGEWFSGKELTTDWTSLNFEVWNRFLADRRSEPLQILELGSWEGRSAIFFLRYCPASRVTCVDTFSGSAEHKQNEEWASSLIGLEERFDRNVAEFGPRLEKIKSTTFEALVSLALQGRRFDVVLVDADHHSCAAYADGVLSWPLLNPEGILIFDDYAWECMETEVERPKVGVDAFLALEAGTYEQLHCGHQLIIRKREGDQPPHKEFAALRAQHGILIEQFSECEGRRRDLEHALEDNIREELAQRVKLIEELAAQRTKLVQHTKRIEELEAERTKLTGELEQHTRRIEELDVERARLTEELAQSSTLVRELRKLVRELREIDEIARRQAAALKNEILGLRRRVYASYLSKTRTLVGLLARRRFIPFGPGAFHATADFVEAIACDHGLPERDAELLRDWVPRMSTLATFLACKLTLQSARIEEMALEKLKRVRRPSMVKR